MILSEFRILTATVGVSGTHGTKLLAHHLPVQIEMVRHVRYLDIGNSSGPAVFFHESF